MRSPTSPIFQGVLEPFEESQGAGVFDYPPTTDESELENMDKPHRKLSRNSSKSLWHRKSTKTTTAVLTPTTMDSKANDTSDEDTAENNYLPSSMSRSIIPDPLRELPTWYKKESDLAAANVSTFRIKYPLHNPGGPKWYKNHHLIPPALRNPGNRPPSVFSPSFPPMAPSLHDHSQDSSRLPGPSRTPSATTLQTPSSSIPDLAGKPRSRKTSQDNADLLDVSDPWGNHWHHHSPYDAGSSVAPVSNDSPDRSRSRLSSMNTAPSRRKTVTPSPLSQSTSALNIQPPEPTTVTRKLSKQRRPVLGNLFGGHDKAESNVAPQRASTIAGSSLQVPHTHGRRNSTVSPSTVLPYASTAALSTHSSTTKERRTSVLGRLVRKFSILKKSAQDAGPPISERADDELHEGASPSEPRRSFVSQRQSSPEKPPMEKKLSDRSKRIPPPRVDPDLMTQETNGRGPSAELERETYDQRSSISYEVPFSPGRLTIANPDSPSSGGTTTPIRLSIALPPEDPHMPEPHLLDIPQRQPVQSRQEHNASWESTSPASPQPNRKTSPVKRVSLVPPTSSSPSILRSAPPQLPSIQSPPFLPYPSFPSASISSPSTAPATTEIRMLHAFSIATSVPSTSDGSPLSNASVLANPPTPYDYDTNELQLRPDFSTDVPNVVHIEKVPSKAPPRDNSPVKKGDGEVIRVAKSNSTTSRKTETFRLMRNPSDKVPSSAETITVEGEHWTVVNSSDAPQRRRTREKVEKNERVERVEKRSSTKDRESRREQRRQEKAVQEAAESHRRATSQGRTKQPKVEAVDSGSGSGRPPRSRSFDTAPRTSVVQPMVFTLHSEPPRHRKSDDRPRDSHHSSKPTRPGLSPISGIAHVERLPSTATRPTSEMMSAADINALRAREAWEMDRLWKGRSMYHGHPEANVITSPSSTRDSRHGNGEFIVDASGHGSSHTSYLVQPLQAHPMPASVFYANMPSAPPPIIYTATSPYGQGHQPSHRSLPNSFTFPSTENTSAESAARPNPLPRPPRQSTYQPAHLPVLSDRSSGPVPDYWTNKYPAVPSH